MPTPADTRAASPDVPRRPSRGPLRLLTTAAVGASLILCLAASAVWVLGNRGDTARTWVSGRRSFQVASWDGTLQFLVAGEWPDKASADRATAILARRAGFVYRPGVEAMTQSLVARRDNLAQQVAQSGVKPVAAPANPNQRPDTLGVWNMLLASSANTLVSEQAPRTSELAGVSVERRTCRLPHTDDAGGMRFDPPVNTVTVSAPCWMPVLLFGAWPGLLLARAAVRSSVRQRRALNNRCPACGYDLRASTGLCPECGHVPRSPVADDASRPARTI